MSPRFVALLPLLLPLLLLLQLPLPMMSPTA